MRGVSTVSEQGECVEETGLNYCECNKAGVRITLCWDVCLISKEGMYCRAFDAAGFAFEKKGNDF